MRFLKINFGKAFMGTKNETGRVGQNDQAPSTEHQDGLGLDRLLRKENPDQHQEPSGPPNLENPGGGRSEEGEGRIGSGSPDTERSPGGNETQGEDQVNITTDISGERKTMKRTKSLYIPARKLFVDPNDLAKDWQRDPIERRRHLEALYGPKGEKFSLEKAGALTVKDRHNGMYAIKDGGGRWWAVMNLLQKPEQELLCVIMEETGDLEAFTDLNSGMHVPNGKKFMAAGSDPENKYEYKICSLLKEFDLTTAPAHKHRSVKVNPVIFAHDLRVLKWTLKLATQHWQKKGPRGIPRIEGIAIAGLAAFLFIYGDDIDEGRLDKVLSRTSYDDIKSFARRWLPANKEHQRQWAQAIARELVTQYNMQLVAHNKANRKTLPRLEESKIHSLQERIISHKHYPLFAQVWEMRKL